MNGILKLFNRLNKLRSKKYRHTYLQEHIRVGIASQIRIIRKKLNISQTQLAEIVKTKQSVISRLEDPDSGSVNLNTLLKIAEAFDVSLIVKFASFGKFLTEYQNISPKDLTVIGYNEEIESFKVQLVSLKMSGIFNTHLKPHETNWTKIIISQNQSTSRVPTQVEDKNVIRTTVSNTFEDKLSAVGFLGELMSTPVYTPTLNYINQ